MLNFERPNILCAWIGPTCEKLWPFELLKSFHCSISSVSIYYVPESDIRVKFMTIRISRELPLLSFVRLDILCAWIGPPSEKLWPFELLKNFHKSISSVTIYYAPESDLRVKSYDQLNFSRASVVQFLVSRYIMRVETCCRLNLLRASTFNFERSDILRASIRHSE